mmetsp:Transcript_83667/g.161506  ORF Transcript_83667/g.161506 Transcript_83667/m.161506 type:complete len:208 (-) Transcript_83667:703-1326(-)
MLNCQVSPTKEAISLRFGVKFVNTVTTSRWWHKVKGSRCCPWTDRTRREKVRCAVTLVWIQRFRPLDSGSVVINCHRDRMLFQAQVLRQLWSRACVSHKGEPESISCCNASSHLWMQDGNCPHMLSFKRQKCHSVPLVSAIGLVDGKFRRAVAGISDGELGTACHLEGTHGCWMELFNQVAPILWWSEDKFEWLFGVVCEFWIQVPE